MKKLSYKYVKEQIEKEGYKLLSNKYKNNNTKLKLQCLEGYIYKVSWANFRQGYRCIKCNIKSTKLTYEFVKEQIEKKGYKLLSTKYINSHSKLKFICPNNHIFKMSWSCFNNNQRCPRCYNELRKLTYEYVKKYIESFDYKLLSMKYTNWKTKLKTECNKGHIYYVSWNHFQQGDRCSECYKLSISGSNNFRWKNYTEEELIKITNYRAAITQLSEQNYKKYKKIINPNNLKRSINEYNLDHIFSIMEGFRRNIPPKYLANPYNLQMLSEHINKSKSDNCDITEKELYKRYTKFINYI